MNMRMMRFRDRGGVSVVIIIMNRLSQLLRRPLEEPHLRKQISGVNMQRRKETRRLKKLNTYSREFTGTSKLTQGSKTNMAGSLLVGTRLLDCSSKAVETFTQGPCPSKPTSKKK